MYRSPVKRDTTIRLESQVWNIRRMLRFDFRTQLPACLFFPALHERTKREDSFGTAVSS